MMDFGEMAVEGVMYGGPVWALVAMVWCWRSRVLRRVLPGHCVHCSYDLTGLEAGKPCPECGLAIRGKDGTRRYVSPGRAYGWVALTMVGCGVLATLIAVIPALVRDMFEWSMTFLYFVVFAALAVVFAVLCRRVDGLALWKIGRMATALTTAYLIVHLGWIAFDPPGGFLWDLTYWIVAAIAVGVAGHALLLGVAWEWTRRRAEKRAGGGG